MRPHKSKYWEHPNIADWKDFVKLVVRICRLRRDGKQLQAQGVHMVSVDEKPGIQAIERDGRTLPMQPGTCERREFNYIRHGTQVLTANLHLGTGRQICLTVADTRTEADFVAHIDRMIRTDPDAPWIILCDQLNTHKSESLVHYVAEAIGDQQEFGDKGKAGIMKSMDSRMAYLNDASHRIHFVYTPKHCSWLNPIEVWFSVLGRHVLNRGNFTSKQDLRQKIERYVAYYNEHLAKVYDWSVVKTEDIRQLIDKVIRAEGANEQRQGVA